MERRKRVEEHGEKRNLNNHVEECETASDAFEEEDQERGEGREREGTEKTAQLDRRYLGEWHIQVWHGAQRQSREILEEVMAVVGKMDSSG